MMALCEVGSVEWNIFTAGTRYEGKMPSTEIALFNVVRAANKNTMHIRDCEEQKQSQHVTQNRYNVQQQV
jgi:hypothetical protein